MSTQEDTKPVDKLELVERKRKLSEAGRKGGKKTQQNTKPTAKQKRVAKLLIENETADKPITQTQILREAGYSEATAATKPGMVVSSPGVQKALAEWGFTPERVNDVLDRALTAKQGTWYQGEYHKSDDDDHKVQLAAVSTLGDFAGIKRYQVEQKSVNINVDASELKDLLGL